MGYKDLTFDKKAVFLITGGAGFIGSNICEALLDMGYMVKCLDNFSTGKKENIISFVNNPRFYLIDGDIRNFETCFEACNRVDFVLHQAAWGSVPKSIEFPQLFEDINIKGTLNMLEASRKSKVRRFVYASSSSVYGDHPALLKQEGIEGRLLSPYALTKKVNEEYAKLYTELYDLETIGLRYFNVFGGRQDPNGYYAAVIPKFVKDLITNNAPTINGDGKQSRDFTYIEDVIQANLKACHAPNNVSGYVYNIAYGISESIIDVYYKICSLLNIQIDPQYGPDRPGDIKHSQADISKAKQFLNYYPEYSFSQGIELVVDWYLRNLQI